MKKNNHRIIVRRKDLLIGDELLRINENVRHRSICFMSDNHFNKMIIGGENGI